MSMALSLLVKFLSYVPFVKRATTRYFHGMRIVTPSGSEAVKEPKITVSGTCTIKPNGDWILLTQRNDEFWPQGDVQFSHTESTWSGAVWLNMANLESSTILLAEIDPGIRCLVNLCLSGCFSKPPHVGVQLSAGSSEWPLRLE
jgi:hypothetical protein